MKNKDLAQAQFKRNRKKMKQLILILTFTFFGINSFSQETDVDYKRLVNYVEYLDSITLSAKNYVLTQFQKYDIVILAERYHTEETQYELINEIIRDDYFISNVGNISIEIGSSNLTDSLNSHLKNFKNSLANGEHKLIEVQRDISFYPIWNRESYRLFLLNLLTLNKSLDNQEKINLYLCDREFDWSKIHTNNQWKEAINNNRDIIIAENISKHFDEIQKSPRKKMLVILNEAHAIPTTEWIDKWQKRAAQYLAEKYGKNRIASILINSVATNESDEDILLQSGYWDAAFDISKKTDIGFDFNNSPFGEDKFDYAIGENNQLFCYKDIFKGFVFYKPIEQHRLSTGVNGLVDSNFRNEFLRRVRIYNGEEYYEKLKKDNQLIGWNKIEYYQYDNLNDMLNEIEKIKKEYYKIKN